MNVTPPSWPAGGRRDAPTVAGVLPVAAAPGGMGPWVRSEYAGELAVLSAWLAALVPWNVTYVVVDGIGPVWYVRFPFAEIQYFPGFEVGGRSFLAATLPAAARAMRDAGGAAYGGYLAWGVGGLLIGVAVAVSVVYYAAEARVEAGPVDPARLIGGLLTAAGVALAAATYLIHTRGLGGVTVPIGVLLVLALGVALLAARRTGDGPAARSRD